MYPLVLCPKNPAILNMQFIPLPMLQQFIDEVDIRVGQLIALVLDLDGIWVVSPLAFHHFNLSQPTQCSL